MKKEPQSNPDLIPSNLFNLKPYDGFLSLCKSSHNMLSQGRRKIARRNCILWRGRLQAAKRAAAELAQLRAPLPVGLVYDDDGTRVTDPDAEVRAAVADIFACSAAAGLAYGVGGGASPACSSTLERAYGGAWAGQLRWGAAYRPPGARRRRRTPPTPAPTSTAATSPARRSMLTGTSAP